MACTLTEALMALGELSVDLEPDPAVLAELEEANLGKRHLILTEMGQPRCRFVLTGRKGKLGGGVTAIGPSPVWLLGTGSDGPTITDREWVSGVNRLSNGLFEFIGADGLPLYWSPNGNTLWTFGGASVGGGSHAAVMLGVPLADDPLPSEEHFPALPGSRYEISGFVARGTNTPDYGRLKLRLTYEGHFRQPNLALPYSTGWDERSRVVSGVTQPCDFKESSDPTGAIPGATYQVYRTWVGLNIETTTEAVMLPATVVPERTYRFTIAYRFDATIESGDVKMFLTVDSPVSPSVDLAGPVLTPSDNLGVQIATQDFTIPSGCTLATPKYKGRGVYGPSGSTGPSIWISQSSLVDTDATTQVFDVEAPHDTHVYGLVNGSQDTPPGSQSVYGSIVAGIGAYGYTVDGLQIRRVDAGPTAARVMVQDLLKAPGTGQQVVEEGTIHDAGNIGVDTRLRNVHLRAGIDAVSSGGLVNPAREWRFTGTGAFDWGLPTELFQQRPNLLLLKDAFVLRDTPEVARTVDSAVDGVIVIGADRPLADGSRRVITGYASDPVLLTVDYQGRPLQRTRVVQDATADSSVTAAILAAYYNDRAHEALAISVGIADPIPYGDLDVGDWVPVYDPTLDLMDTSNEMADPSSGETVWPIWLRVLSRSGSFAQAGMKLTSLDPATGEEVDLTDFVQWSTETTQTLDLGLRLPDFTANPDGGAPAIQFLRWRSAVPR